MIAPLLMTVLLAPQPELDLAKLLQAGQVSPAAFSVMVPFDFSRGQVTVQVKVGKETVLAMVDTGAVTFISANLAKKLGAKKLGVAEGTQDFGGNTKDTDVVKLESIQVGAVTFRDIGAAVIDSENGFFGRTGTEAILGANLLRHAKVQIDYGKSELRLSNDINSLIKGDEAKIAFEPSSQYTPKTTLTTGTVEFQSTAIDTGSVGGIEISLEYLKVFEKAKKTFPQATRTGYQSRSLFGEHIGEEVDGWFDVIYLKNMPIRPGVVSFTKNTHVTIGNEFFHPGVLTFDWEAKRAYLGKITEMGGRRLEGYGWRPMFHEGAVRVADIVKGSQAEKAGIKPGDEVVKVGSLDLSTFPQIKWDQLKAILEKEGELMVVWRQGREQKTAQLSYQVFLPVPKPAN